MKLSEEIKILSPEECELLRADKLVKSRRNRTELYLICESGKYTAFDYADRQAWIELFGKEAAPVGHEKKFDNPLRAIDWLLETRK